MRHGQRLGAVLHRVAQHHELVAAEPGDEVAGPHHGTEALGHLDQELVPGVVAEAIVDQLEAVEIEEGDGGEALRAPGAGQCGVHGLEQAGPVG